MDGFLRNVWQMAAWSEEVGTALLSRRIAGRKLVLFRRSDGAVAALDDRCPHRFAPLSMGERKGDTIACGYHGLEFDSGGRCVHNPFSDRIPAGASVRTYPVAERDGIVWVWQGDPAGVEDSTVPDFAFLADGPTNRTVRGYTFLPADYRFGLDNLLDLSHIEYTHRGSFAGNGVIFAGEHTVQVEGERVHSNWWMPDVAAPAHTMGEYDPTTRTDHWLDMRWDAPGSMYLQIGAVPCGGAREEGCIVHQAHILTPETDGTTHYFWASTRSNAVDSTEMDTMLRELFARAFAEEDLPMIEACFRNIDGGDFWEQKPVFLGIDAGGPRARRIIEAKLARERGQPIAAE